MDQIGPDKNDSENDEPCYDIDTDENTDNGDIFADEIRFIWIDTPPIQCRKNIINRGRLNDLQDLGRILQVNAELYARLSSSPIHFERVKVFEMNERW